MNTARPAAVTAGTDGVETPEELCCAVLDCAWRYEKLFRNFGHSKTKKIARKGGKGRGRGGDDEDLTATQWWWWQWRWHVLSADWWSVEVTVHQRKKNKRRKKVVFLTDGKRVSAFLCESFVVVAAAGVVLFDKNKTKLININNCQLLLLLLLLLTMSSHSFILKRLKCRKRTLHCSLNTNLIKTWLLAVGGGGDDGGYQ